MAEDGEGRIGGSLYGLYSVVGDDVACDETGGETSDETAEPLTSVFIVLGIIKDDKSRDGTPREGNCERL